MIDRYLLAVKNYLLIRSTIQRIFKKTCNYNGMVEKFH